MRDGDVSVLIPVERDTTYTINSDASFTYTADYTYHNDGSVAEPVVIGFSVLFHGATVTTNNFDSFTFDGENPGYFNEYGADFSLPGYLDPAGSCAATNIRGLRCRWVHIYWTY